MLLKMERKLAKLQRQFAQKEKGSNNYDRIKRQIALCHEKITNTRKDHPHKISHEIVSENQVIVSENLQIKNMGKNHHQAKCISDASWYELTRQLEDKAEWNKRKYVKIDPFYAGSQLCSACGYQNAGTKDLSVRKWVCPKCGTEHDRDINAARNILAEGLRHIAPGRKYFVFLIVYLTGSTPFISISGVLSVTQTRRAFCNDCSISLV